MRLRPICVADNFAHFIFVLSSQNLGRLDGAHTSNGFSEKLRQFVSHSISNNVFFKCRSWRRLNVTSRVMSCKSIYTSICNKEIIMRVTMLYSVASQIFSIFLIVVKNVSRVGREGGGGCGGPSAQWAPTLLSSTNMLSTIITSTPDGAHRISFFPSLSFPSISTLQLFINSCWKHRRLRFKADTTNKIDDLRPHEIGDAELANAWTTKLSFDFLLTVHLSIFITVFNQLDAQNFCFTINFIYCETNFVHQVG